MVGEQTNDVETKVVSIPKVLKDSPEPMAARLIAYRLRDCGICLGLPIWRAKTGIRVSMVDPVS